MNETDINAAAAEAAAVPARRFSLGLVVGRFQLLHRGHEQLVDTALALCDETAVFIGSSQESGTARNPFSYELRCELLRNIYGESIRIFPLPDIGAGNNPVWGGYVLEQSRLRLGREPQLLISGRESRRLSWFDGSVGAAVAELYIPKTIDISATQVRELLLCDDYTQWCACVNEKNHHLYRRLRETVLEAQHEQQTQSI